MLADRVRSIVIGGGGAPAWLAAATLGRRLRPEFCEIRVIDSGRSAAGAFSEAALPSFHRLNSLLGINESDLLQKTRGTFKLGAQFADWARLGDRYFHTFGPIGAKLDAVPFHHYWIKLYLAGHRTRIEDYSTATVAAQMRRFAHPAQDRRSVLAFYSYGYHFDSALLAGYLKEYAQAHGVIHLDRDVAAVRLRGEDGFVDTLQLDDGSEIRADLFIDCAGAGGGLSQQALNEGYQDWGRWLPCDRAVALTCAGAGELAPYSESTAQDSGWRWRIPLQHCVDSGYAYSSSCIGDDAAATTLLADLPGAALTEPRFLRMSPGRPAKFWDKNCIALPGSNLPSLESTALHLVQTGITRLLTLFPVCRFSPSDIAEYNRLATMEHERIRDFLILHFKATQRRDSPFWEHCGHMDIPDTLRAKIELFERCGRIALLDDEHFGEDSWISLFLGQNVEPQDYDPLADAVDIEEVKSALSRMRSMIKDAVDTMPTHSNFIAEHCAAKSDGLGARWQP